MRRGGGEKDDEDEDDDGGGGGDEDWRLQWWRRWWKWRRKVSLPGFILHRFSFLDNLCFFLLITLYYILNLGPQLFYADV